MTTSALPPPLGLARYSKFVVAALFVLLFLGGLVTSWQAGMAVPDWPLSFGSVNPTGWWQNFPVRLEHGHRLFASFVGLLIIGLVVWIWRTPAARSLRLLAILALVGVILQGTFGGLRVTLQTAGHEQAAFALRIIHGCVAQAVLCLAVVLATRLSPAWRDWSARAAAPSTFAWVTAAVIYVQLIVAASMRHLGAGLAISTFPGANPDGGFMPRIHSAGTDLNFTHTRFLAGIILILVVVLFFRVRRTAADEPRLRRPAHHLLALVVIQIILGVSVIWHWKPPTLTTFHVVNGAAVLATAVHLALRLSHARRAA